MSTLKNIQRDINLLMRMVLASKQFGNDLNFKIQDEIFFQEELEILTTDLVERFYSENWKNMTKKEYQLYFMNPTQQSELEILISQKKLTNLSLKHGRKKICLLMEGVKDAVRQNILQNFKKGDCAEKFKKKRKNWKKEKIQQVFKRFELQLYFGKFSKGRRSNRKGIPYLKKKKNLENKTQSQKTISQQKQMTNDQNHLASISDMEKYFEESFQPATLEPLVLQ